MALNLFTFLVLIGAAYWDIRKAKVKNWYAVSALVLGGFLVAFLEGWVPLGYGLLTSLAALALGLIFISIGIMGAGDMKLLVACAICWTPETLLATVAWSFVWGALLGVIRAALAGHLVELWKNTLGLLYKPWRGDHTTYGQIPFTVAILMGWLSVTLPTLYRD